jgi:hypothetical protein
MAYKTWAVGDVIAAADLNTISAQSVSVFTNAADRTSKLVSGTVLGQPSFLDDLNQVQIYDGAVWQPLPAQVSAFTAAGPGTAIASGSSALVSIVLPTGRFSVAPIIAGLTTSGAYLTPVVNSVNAGTVTVALVNNGALSQAATVTVYGLAVAMTYGTAAG